MLRSIDIGGEAGNSVFDPTNQLVYVNVQSAGRIAVIDPAVDKVIDTIAVPDCVSNHGLVIDASGTRAFVGCEGNAVVLVVDLTSKKVLQRFEVGETPDVMALDASLGRLYVACESGDVSVFDLLDGQLDLVAQARLAPSAHTIAVDQTTHRVFPPLEDIDGHPVLLVLKPSAIR